MALTRTDETELLTALHEGMHETPRWSSFLSRLRRRTRADNATLTVGHGESGALEAELMGYDRLRPGRVYADDELVDLSGGPGRRQAASGGFARIMRVIEPGGASAWIMLSRADSDFSAADGAVLVALAAHLAIALRNLAVLEREQMRLGLAEAALVRAGIGWAAFDEQGRVIEANAAGARLPREAGASRSLAQLAQSVARAPHFPGRAARIGEDPPADALVLRPPPQDLTVTARPAALALLRALTPSRAGQDRLLAQSFGLALSEARLALQLADGFSIAEAADRLGLTIETARNYSKRLYAKTGARGQGELVRLVLGSAATLG